MAKYIGGIIVTSVRWVGTTAIRVRFTSENTGYQHQLYYGRRLVASTSNSTQRELTAQIDGGRWQDELTVLAVNGLDVGVDHGADLPPGAYNVAKVTFSTTGFADDTETIELFTGDEPGGAVTSTPVVILPYEGVQTYETYTRPLAGSGTWNIEVAGRDGRLPTGNAGTAAATTVTVIAAPPDFDIAFSATVANGTLTASATIPTD